MNIQLKMKMYFEEMAATEKGSSKHFKSSYTLGTKN